MFPLYRQAFIQALLSTADFPHFAKSVNFDLQVAGKCISGTLPLLISTIFPVNIMMW